MPGELAFAGLLSADLDEQKAALLQEMQRDLKLSPAQFDKVSTLVKASRWLSQGNPKITEHPMTRAECRAIREKAPALPGGDARCGHENMVPLYDPSQGETAASARVCIDQYEFPNLPCEYPLVWVKANETVELCQAMGKRICDAHEWEGACAGELKPAESEYAFGQRRMMIEYLHNQERKQVWAYGASKDHSKCATMSKKSASCTTIDWGVCGSNTYPAGAFPDCRSSLGVFDQHGNAAEHMNMPIKPEQLASRGGLGETEMKGSWFIFTTYEAHPDDCRWRAPMWHKTRMDDPASHRNYHLGFRCCSDIGGTPAASSAVPSAAPAVPPAAPSAAPSG
ncbi:MAG: SUMF1/EgtB/PvdO family nonheme iron enzyme [Polyangiaceae bacterium]